MKYLLILLSVMLLGIGVNSCSNSGNENKKAATSESKELWTCGMHPEVILEHPGQCPKCGMDLVPLKTNANSDAQHEHSDDETVGKQGQTQELWTCGMHPEVLLDHPGQCPKCGMDLVPVKTEAPQAESNDAGKERKILYWQAPMDPTEIYDHPGKSKMGMDLIPVYEDQVSGGPEVRIDPVTIQNMGVRTAIVEKEDFINTVRTVGYVAYNEEKVSEVSVRFSGWIEKLYVEYTGERVRKGQTLMEIYSPELVTTQKEYLLAVENFRQLKDSPFEEIKRGAQNLLNSTRQRLVNWNIPASEIKKLEQTGQVRRTLKIESPSSGFIVHKNVTEGQFVKEGMSLFRIADLSTVWVQVSLYENESVNVSPGDKAEMSLDYIPGKTFSGKISYVYPYVEEKAKVVRVRLEFPNKQELLKPGMYAHVKLETDHYPDAVVVPSEAIIRTGERNLVFIKKDRGRFEPRKVVIGAENAQGKVQILSGLREGEEIVTSAQFLLDSESRLQEAIQKMLAARK